MRKMVMLVLLVGVMSSITLGERQGNQSTQPAGAEQVVQIQLEAYNHRDVDAFLNTYASDAKLYDHPDKLWASGLEQMRQVYSRLFKEAPNLHAKVSNRIVQGEFVIDQELVTGLPDNQKITAVAIYQVKGGKIANVWFVR
jgi:hypothetical protein